jgi:hypothetical protein
MAVDSDLRLRSLRSHLPLDRACSELTHLLVGLPWAVAVDIKGDALILYVTNLRTASREFPQPEWFGHPVRIRKGFAAAQAKLEAVK